MSAALNGMLEVGYEQPRSSGRKCDGWCMVGRTHARCLDRASNARNNRPSLALVAVRQTQ